MQAHHITLRLRRMVESNMAQVTMATGVAVLVKQVGMVQGRVHQKAVRQVAQSTAILI